MSDVRPLILTARLDSASQYYFNDVRRAHFPAERNHLDAHLTLFHALPGSEWNQILARLQSIAENHRVLSGQVTGLRFLGRGVAYSLACQPLMALRASLLNAFYSFLTPQDRQNWRPHITVQNKVSPDTARALLRRLEQQFEPKPVEFTALDLWYYEGGPWTLAESFAFRAD